MRMGWSDLDKGDQSDVTDYERIISACQRSDKSESLRF